MRAMLIVFAFLMGATAAFAQEQPKVHVRLISEDKAVGPGQSVTIALEERIAEGWHTYWKNPGDAGAPTQIDWTLPQGWHAGAIQWPRPKRLPVGPLMDYGYEGKVWLLDSLSVPIDAKPGNMVNLKAAVNWLVCKNICIPEDRAVSLALYIGQTQKDPDVAQDFAAVRAQLPVVSPWKLAYAQNAGLDLFIAAPSLVSAHPIDVEFFPANSGVIKNAAPQLLGYAQNGLVLRLQPAARLHGALEGLLVLTSRDRSVEAIQIDAPAGQVPPAEFLRMNEADLTPWLALLFAFLGGLILNVMPCVLPILAMKALAVARHGQHGRAESFSYAGGAILSFIILGLSILVLRGSGEAIGWGFQLQSPVAVAAFALLLFAVGLNLSGVFEVGSVTAGEAFTRRSGLPGAFFTGILAVAVAAPCTAPFMAAALGFALTQPVLLAVCVFTALGLGFSLPFLLIGLRPSLLQFIPKPGAWMVRLKEFLAFPMYGASAWLAWVLAQETGARGIGLLFCASLALALACWMWSTTRQSSLAGRRIGAGLALLVLVAGFWSIALLRGSNAAPVVQARKGEIYNPGSLAMYRAQNRPVFIDATAAWCITCLVNEDAVLSRPQVQSAFADHKVVYMIADWTSQDPQITELLKDYNRSGVPLYLYYAPGAKSPVILPQILTESSVLSVLKG